MITNVKLTIEEAKGMYANELKDKYIFKNSESEIIPYINLSVRNSLMFLHYHLSHVLGINIIKAEIKINDTLYADSVVADIYIQQKDMSLIKEDYSYLCKNGLFNITIIPVQNPINNKKYDIIYCDPPWSFKNKHTGGSMKSGSATKYYTMSIEELKQLDVNSIASDNCVLFMWWVGSQPESALKLVSAWGFTLKTMTGFVWVKNTKNGKPDFGMGTMTRAGSESCLIAVKGKPVRENASVRSVVYATKGIHSKKPDEVRNRIVQLIGNKPRVELFARERVTGWDSMGYMIDGVDIKETLKVA
jgi:N6-adenosine-specific RNA methylase IME4